MDWEGKTIKLAPELRCKEVMNDFVFQLSCRRLMQCKQFLSTFLSFSLSLTVIDMHAAPCSLRNQLKSHNKEKDTEYGICECSTL